MTKFFAGIRPRCARLRAGLSTVVLCAAVLTARAQFIYSPSTTASVAGTYTDLGTTGTAISTANTDDANSAAQPIGFTFTYNGTAFTQFVLNTNGLLRFGASAPSSAAAASSYGQDPGPSPMNSTDPADVNLLLPFNADLRGGTAGAEYRVATTGAAGSRICTIQWKNVADKTVPLASSDTTTLPTQYDNFSFQVKLYEGSRQIDFVYNTPTPGANSATKAAVVGLKGSGTTANQNITAIKPSAAAWDETTFGTGEVGAFEACRYRISSLPDAGRTFRFTPLKANDVAVSGLYTYGRLATGVNQPHAVKALLTNRGYNTQTNVAATLRITGANTLTSTKTVASLASGDTTTVTFDSYPATLADGTNVVTVTIPADDDNTNNSATYGQVVNPTRVSYLDPTRPAPDSVGVGLPGVALGTFAVKYQLVSATTLAAVTLGLARSAEPATTYQVLIYKVNPADGLPDSVLYTSPVQTRTAASSTPVLALPNVAVPAAFFIAVQELDNPINLRYQNEYPLRPDSHYYSLNNTDWASLELGPGIGLRLAIEFTTAPVTCQVPFAPTAGSVTATGASISFGVPASGIGSYQVVYGPVGFNPATAGTTVTATTSPAVLTGLNPATTYQVYLRSSCSPTSTSAFTNPIIFTTGCSANALIASFPYEQNFELIAAGQALPCGFTTLDANGDNATWRITKTSPSSGVNALRYTSALTNGVAADDWAFTPALRLASGTRYQVAFRYRGEGVLGSPSPYVEKLEVKVGATPTPAGQTTLLYTNSSIANVAYEAASNVSIPVVASFTPAAGTQYVGFHVFSDANQGNLYLDDIRITAAVVTATTSEALLRAVSVFPNPSTTGVFDLEIHGANASRGLEVLVTNMLGQQVYTGSARDNYTNRLDLSRLAPGLYHLRVRHGAETLTRQLAIAR